MSSILDALRKLEAAEAAPAAGPVAAEIRRAGARWIVAGVLLAFAAGAGVALWLRSPAPTREEPELLVAVEPAPAVLPPAAPAQPEPSPPQPAAAPPAADALPLVPPTPPPTALAETDPPRGEVGTRDGAPAAGVPDIAVPPARVASVPPELAPPPAPPEPAPRAEPEPAAAAPAVEPDQALVRPPPGAPRVQVNFLVYSRAPERRTVALTVDGRGFVTLHEGEADGDLEVARILADRVQLRWAGQVYTVFARE